MSSLVCIISIIYFVGRAILYFRPMAESVLRLMNVAIGVIIVFGVNNIYVVLSAGASVPKSIENYRFMTVQGTSDDFFMYKVPESLFKDDIEYKWNATFDPSVAIYTICGPATV